jgi:uncharacterized protein
LAWIQKSHLCMNRCNLPKGFLFLVLFQLSFAAGLSSASGIGPEKENAPIQDSPVCDYARPGQPLIKPVFIPLPIGDVQPTGWLRDWAEAAANGITGHLDEYSPVFKDAWRGVPIADPHAASDGTGWPLEQSSYWLDGLVRLGYVLHDETLIKKARARLDLIVDGVNGGGVSFIYWITNQPAGFNSWAHSQMGRALVAYYEATGDPRILNALDKAYRNYPVPMGTLDLTDVNVSGLCNLDALLETYSFSGDKQLLARATLAMERPEVQSSINDWLLGRYNPCHTVCYYEIIRIPAMFYPWSGQEKYLEASRKAFAWVDTEHMLPHGVASGGEFLSGIGPFRLTETCDVSASLWSRLWMYRITGESSWGDQLETEFFNAAAAPIARDFQTMCYYQSPNRLQPESQPIGHPLCPGPGCLRFTRLGYPKVLCCVGNMNRIIPNYIIHMWMATQNGGLAATLYGPCLVHALAGDHVPVKLTCQTDYPFKDTIHVAVKPSQATSFPLYFRIPDWCHMPVISVNGKPISVEPSGQGFVRIERLWSPGDTVTLKFPMSVRLDRAYADEYPAANRGYYGYLPKEVFQPKRLPYESIYYGPLLFALPIPDLNPNTPIPGADWQFALDNDPRKSGGDIIVKRRSLPSKWNWPLAAPIVLKVPAKQFDWNPTMARDLPNTPVTGEKSRMISLVPYGCTKFRVSMFPVTLTAWEGMTPANLAETTRNFDDSGIGK